ncbi:FlgB family protein [Lentibacter algarum]|uniref:FlgB family protein n=1 Tax=Lentibacter algarum TaxID=576131 RepID=UPI001C0680AB|nr:FlgB family protein [Lentibacter algarum]MBU2981206.1 FlgB family protein [Lentibacter algarum]
MLDKISLFQVAQSLARHSGARQAVLAQNIANADTPGYAARDVAPFSLAPLGKDAGAGMIASRASHLTGAHSMQDVQVVEARNRSSDPNKNGVTLQEEMLLAADTKRQHDKALAIYKSGMRILRTSLNDK